VIYLNSRPLLSFGNIHRNPIEPARSAFLLAPSKSEDKMSEEEKKEEKKERKERKKEE
jgi:hypothetical protein